MSNRVYNTSVKIKDYLLSVIKSLLKTFLNSKVGLGIFKKIIGFVVENAFDEIVDPLLSVALIKIGYKMDVKEGKRHIVQLHRAREENNAEDYNSTVDDILS